MRATRRGPAALAGLVAALVLVSLPLLGRASLVEATSWIDAPLDGAVLPPGPQAVVAHSADQGGVAEVILEVDGVELDSLVGDGRSRLMTSRFRWIAGSLGTHVLVVRARNADGEWGASASATVVISGDAPAPAPSGSPGAAPTTGATLGPGQTQTPAPTGGATPGPGATRAPTPRPTSTRAPTPAPTYCAAPVATLDSPTGYVQLDYPSQASPLFEWHYSGGTGCIASQVLYVYNLVVGVELTIDLGPGARMYEQRSSLPWDPDNPDQQCAHYHWTITAFNAVGDGEPSAPGSFDICELNPDA